MKEYDKYNHELLFSEEYSNGEKNGHGREYRLIFEKNKNDSNNSLSRKNPRLVTIFSGEYLNWKRIEGEEYNYNKKKQYMKENIYMEKEMDKEKNMIRIII